MAGGSNNKKRFNKSKPRKPTNPSLFVEGGLLSDWSPVTTSPPSRGKSTLNASRKQSALRYEIGGASGGKLKASCSNSRMIGSQKLKRNVFAYNYPQVSQLVDESGDEHKKFDESNPVVLVDSKESKIIAYMDQGPVADSEAVSYSYDYGASFEVDDSSRIGLGFHVESEENPSIIEATPVNEKTEYSRFDSSSSHEMETDMMDDDDNASSSPVTNSGFLSIGGVKLYTHDISFGDDDEEEDDDNNDGDDNDDDEDSESLDSEDSCNSSDSDDAYNTDSEIDDEIANDYFEGIGGSYKYANVDEIIGQMLDSSDDEEDDINNGRFSEMLKGVSGIALQDASREYNKKKPRSNNKNRSKPAKFGAGTDDWSAIDDLKLVKNSRSMYGKKKHVAKLPQSWPSIAEKSKNFRSFPGEKKVRQAKIASKRRDRMISRGVDLEKINYKLEQMVKNKGNMMSFQLMHSRDCSQVQRLAAIYHLHSGCQGSGRKRFVTVTRTQHTCMPSSTDRIRLDKLLGMNEEANDTPAGKIPSNRIKKEGLGPLDPKSAKSNDSSKKKRRDKDKTGSYAAQPVSFISSGTMVSEPEKTMVDHQMVNNNKSVASSSNYGVFEMHTTGFGSRMMAKMGYVDGGGLGKDGTGISEPIEAIQWPKSLGLGAKMPDTSEAVNATPPPRKPNRVIGQGSRGSESRGKSGNAQNVHFGSFEKHTKGFGSKMMAKMGFVEGMGLGRDSQGIVQPLVASRLPKSRGLGAKG